MGGATLAEQGCRLNELRVHRPPMRRLGGIFADCHRRGAAYG
jgi:hypothetical protein